MATISENLQTIKSSMSAIKQAISDKGGDVSGDISTWANTISNIEGGGGKEIVEVNAANGSIVFNGTEFRPSFEPNKIYYATSTIIESLYIGSVIPPTEDVGEYSLHFSCNEEADGLWFEVPSNWIWANGETPSLEPNTHYELSVVAIKFGTDYIYKAVLTPFKSVE